MKICPEHVGKMVSWLGGDPAILNVRVLAVAKDNFIASCADGGENILFRNNADWQLVEDPKKEQIPSEWIEERIQKVSPEAITSISNAHVFMHIAEVKRAILAYLDLENGVLK